MNNCPKCGNPLQVGTTSCPICGTNISASEPVKTPVTESVSVASVSQPVPAKPVASATQVQKESSAPAPQVAPAPIAAPASTPVSEQTASKAPEAPAKPASEPVKQEPAQSSTAVSAPTQSASTQPVQTTQVSNPVPAAEAAPTPSVEVAPTKAVEPITDPNAIAPTITKIEASTPVPNIPASIEPTAPTPTPEVTAPQVTTTKPKKKMNKNVLVIGGILLVAIIGVVLYTSLGQTKKITPTQTTTPTENLATTAISSNGYNFKLEDGWMITEDGSNVIVTNSTDTVVIKLSHLDSNIETIGVDNIENYFKSRTEFTESKVEEMEISTKKAILVSANYSQAQVQYYYIASGTNLTIGATVIYQSNESKTKYEADVTELIGTLTYADESIKAIDTIEMYSTVFGLYNDVLNFNTTPQVDNQNQVTPDQNQGGTTTPDPNQQPDVQQ